MVYNLVDTKRGRVVDLKKVKFSLKFVSQARLTKYRVFKLENLGIFSLTPSRRRFISIWH